MKASFSTISTRIIAIVILIFALLQLLYIININSVNYQSLFHENKKIELVLILLFAFSSFIIAYGLWKLKKWAFYIYLFITIIYQITMLIKDKWNISLIILPTIFITILALNNKKLK